jgi:hypothetical protein
MKLVFSILGNVLDYMVQNSVRSLPTETPLKKPLFHKKVWVRKPSTQGKNYVHTYTSAITLFLNLLSMGSQGKVEEYMETRGVELRELRQSLDWITASLQARNGNREGSILASYADDDKAMWKEF